MSRVRVMLFVLCFFGCRTDPHSNASEQAESEQPPPKGVHLSPPPRHMISIAGGAFRGSKLLCEPGTAQLTFGHVGVQPDRLPLSVEAFAIDRDVASCFDMDRCIESGVCTAKLRANYRCENGVAIVPHAVASEFCSWRGMKLPTYAQWQRAARGVDGWVFPKGDYSPNCDRASPGNKRDERCLEVSPDGMHYTTEDANYELARDLDCELTSDFSRPASPARFVPVEILLQQRRLNGVTSGNHFGQFRCVEETQP